MTTSERWRRQVARGGLVGVVAGALLLSTACIPTVQTCVNNATGAFRFVSTAATPTGTGVNRSCATGETLVTWLALIPSPPFVYACMNVNTGAARFVNEVRSATGTGMARDCAAGETLVTWSVGQLPTIFACVNTASGAGRFVTAVRSPTGTGQSRDCAAGEALVAWSGGAPQ